MCMAVVCPECNKPTWRGCGAHIEQVLGSVPKDQRCKCREKSAASASTSKPGTPGSSR
jgi:hypothetical protein